MAGTMSQIVRPRFQTIGIKSKIDMHDREAAYSAKTGKSLRSELNTAKVVVGKPANKKSLRKLRRLWLIQPGRLLLNLSLIHI